MNVSLYQAASALNANTRWQEVVASNLAASAVPGFKKQELTVEAVQSGLLSPSADAAPTAGFVLPRLSAGTDFRPGEMRQTGLNTDVAIDGAAFFEVQLPDGSTGYTRDGEFHLDAQGRLVTKQGFPVMGDNGPVQLDPNLGGPLSETIGIAADGTISQGSERRGKLSLVEFNNPALLTSVPGGFFVAQDPGLKEVGNSTATVRQRWLEMANTSPVIEMANLLTAMRSFESNQRIVQMQDERMGKVISELSNG